MAFSRDLTIRVSVDVERGLLVRERIAVDAVERMKNRRQHPADVLASDPFRQQDHPGVPAPFADLPMRERWYGAGVTGDKDTAGRCRGCQDGLVAGSP